MTVIPAADGARTLHTFLTLDGVMQAPGAPDEDPDGGFAHGGWSFPYDDEDFGAAMVGWFGHASAFLLGRKTYEIFSSYWPRVTDPANPIAGRLNALPKYVASATLASADWRNSSLLGGDVAAEVARLRELPGDELQARPVRARPWKADGYTDRPGGPDPARRYPAGLRASQTVRVVRTVRSSRADRAGARASSSAMSPALSLSSRACRARQRVTMA